MHPLIDLAPHRGARRARRGAQPETPLRNAIAAAIQAAHPSALVWLNRTGVALSVDGKRRLTFGLRGSPDIIAIVDGRFVGVEVKVPAGPGRRGGRQSDAQRRFQRACEKAGGLYIVARGPDEVVKQISSCRAAPTHSPFQ